MSGGACTDNYVNTDTWDTIVPSIIFNNTAGDPE